MPGNFPKRHNGPNPPRGRTVTQETLSLRELKQLLDNFEAANPPNSVNPNDQWVYVVQSVTGSPMAALMLSPTKAGDD